MAIHSNEFHSEYLKNNEISAIENEIGVKFKQFLRDIQCFQGRVKIN